MTRIVEHEPPDQATVAAYLSNQLDPSDADAFEIYCLRHPEFARDVERDLQFKVGMRQVQVADQARRVGKRRRLVFAIAACFALLVCGALLLVPRLQPEATLAYRSTTEVPRALLAGPRVGMTLIRVRAGTAVHRVAAPQGAGLLALRVLPDAPSGSRGYAMGISLESEIISRSSSLTALHPDADGYVNVYLPVTAVVGHTLRITLNPSPATGTDPLSFRVQVAYAENGTP